MPTAMSSWPDHRASSTWQAATRVMNSVPSCCRPSSRSRAVTSAGTVERDAPRRPRSARPGGAGRWAAPAAARRPAAAASSPAARQRRHRRAVALPGGEVGVLHRQRRQVRRVAVQRGGVQRRQLLEQHAGRPAVGDDVVQGQREHVVVGRPAGPAGPAAAGRCRRSNGRSASSASSRAARATLGRRPARSTHGSATLVRVADAPARRGRPRSSNVVRSDSCRATSAVSAALQRRRRRARRAAAAPRRHVLGAVRLELVEEPQPLLGERQRQRRPSRAHRRGSRRPPRRRPALAGQQRGQPGDGRRGEQRPRRHPHAERRPQPGDHPDAQDRVAAQVEEVVVRRRPAPPRAPRTRPGQQPLGLGARRDVLGAVGGGRSPARAAPGGPACR